MWRPLDRSRGRLINVSGVDYYSPNCSRTIEVPKETDPKFLLTLGWKDFTEPRWWTDTHGWLAFVPREPMLVGFPFDHLARLPQTFSLTSEGKYELP